MNLSQLYDELFKHATVLVVHPDNLERVEQAVSGLSGLFYVKVQPSRFVEKDQIIVMHPDEYIQRHLEPTRAY